MRARDGWSRYLGRLRREYQWFARWGARGFQSGYPAPARNLFTDDPCPLKPDADVPRGGWVEIAPYPVRPDAARYAAKFGITLQPVRMIVPDLTLSSGDHPVRLYTCTDREGVIHRRWITTEPNARAWAQRYVWGWTLLVDSSGRIIEEK
jgi:hypothetical protein